MLKVLLALTLLLGSTAAVLWFNGTIPDWIKDRAVQTYAKQIQPFLPFEIEDVKLDGSPADFLKKGSSRLNLVVKWGQVRVRLGGDIFIKKSGLRGNLRVEYAPKATLEPISDSSKKSDSFGLRIEVVLSPDLARLQELALQVSSENWEWDYASLGLEGFELKSGWLQSSQEARLQLKFSGLSLARSDDKNEYFKDFHVTGKVPLKLQPTEVGRDIDLNWELGGLELMSDLDFLSVPLQAFSGSSRVRLNLEGPNTIESASVQFKKGQIDLAFSGQFLEGKWKSQPISLLMLEGFLSQLSGNEDDGSGDVTRIVQSGLVTSKGEFKLPINAQQDFLDLAQIRLDADFTKVSLFDRSSEAGLKDAALDFRFSTEEKRKSIFRLPYLHVKKLEGSLPQIEFELLPKRVADRWTLDLSVEPIRRDFGDALSLLVGQILGRLEVTRDLSEATYRVETSASVQKLKVRRMAGLFCAETGLIPEAEVEVRLPRVLIQDGSFETKGGAQARLFNGFIELNDLSVYDLLSEVPEVQFEAKWDGLQLAEVGKWLNFGEMNGVVVGHAKNVTFQALLPTNYDFQFQIKPYEDDDIVFSPEAMKNTVRLFAGDELDATLPRFADWIAFGWPSRLFGGYNIQYAGLSLFAHDGAIMVETLDPPEILEKERNHFILYGARFKIPLKGARYPVVLDGPGMANLVERIVGQIAAIQDASEKQEGLESPEDSEQEGLEENEDVESCIPRAR